MTAILPPGIEPLSKNTLSAWHNSFEEVKLGLSEGYIPAEQALELMMALPSETLRSLVEEVAGTNASFLTTFTKQVRLVDAVLTQLVYPDGRIKESAVESGISLKDALTMSTRISQMLIKDLPKLYTIERIQRLERAFGDVLEEFFDAKQQNAVLERLAELTKDIK